ncbi:MAG: LLM class flavin-dependent oxidoreductase [Deltaproteobacteria bacterium]|nr:LLM class flavin-dependent oxidoreductase [Deltaproteobacteria bacterium]
MHKIQFGVRVPNSGPLSSIENIVKATKHAEELGFDSIWVHDHVVWSSEMHRHHISSGAAEAVTDTQEANFYEATSVLSYLAAETKKITLGVACLVMPCRNPIYAAKQYATLDWLCKGRLIVGVGLGSKATRESDEFGVFGVPYDRRGDRADEYIQAMKAVWTQPIASYQGEFIRFKDAEIYPKPVQKPHPPVAISWLRPREKTAAIRPRSRSPSRNSRPSARRATKESTSRCRLSRPVAKATSAISTACNSRSTATSSDR